MKLKGKAKIVDDLHLAYETLLVSEIESLLGLASVHGWQSKLYLAGKRARRMLKDAGSQIELPEGE